MKNKRLYRAAIPTACMLSLLLSLVCPYGAEGFENGKTVYAMETTAEAGRKALEAALASVTALDSSQYTDLSAAMQKAAAEAAEELLAEEMAEASELEAMADWLELIGPSMRQKQENTVYDGEYTITGRMWHAAENQASMGNAALVQPMTLRKSGDSVSLELEFQSLKIGNMTGYLYQLFYFPDWTDKTQLPYTATPVELTVLDYYDGVYDYYNDPASGKDALAKGNLYPHHMSMPIDWQDDEVWVQVYVPVMEEINAGSGSQIARLQLDWSTLIQTAGAVTDRSTLDAYITKMTGALEQLSDASEKEAALLAAVLAAGGGLQSDMNASQTEINAMVKVLKAANIFFGGTEEGGGTSDASSSVDKGSLHMILLAASSIAGRDGYTSASIKALKNAIAQAEAVYQNPDATQESVDSQTNAVSLAIVNLEAKPVSSTSGTSTSAAVETTGSGQTTDEEEESGSTDSDEELDIKKLEDGTYSVTGTMVKIDKKTSSMANEAINHTIKLTVKKGKYKLSLVFSGLTINSQKGYLGALKYYKTGYHLNSYGSPEGKLGTATVNSYQEDSSGTRLTDTFGTNYPKQVTFPLISEALDDGYVPLQVFVPIMESISAGSGTQAVFLKLDTDSVKSTTEDDSSFTEETESSTGTVTTTSSAATASSSGVSTQTLPTGTKSSTKSSTKAPALSQGAAVKSGAASDTVTLTSTVGSDTSFTTDAQIPEENGEETDAKDAQETASGSEESDVKKNALPFAMSVFSALLGVLYKAGSMGLFRRK